MHTQVDLVVVHTSTIGAVKRLIIAVAIVVLHGSVDGTPDIANIGTDRQALEWRPAGTHIYLMQTAFTLVGVGVGNILVVLVHPSAGRIVVSHVGERDNTETHTQMTEEAEACYHIFEIRVIGILLHPVLVEVGYLTRDTCIQDESHGVDGCIGSRVQIVNLIMLMKTKSNTIHTTVEARSLFRQNA